MRLSPSEIRFTQKTIKECFEDGKNVNDVINDVQCNRLPTNKLPHIKVFSLNSKYYTLDDRHLYVFRVLQQRFFLYEIPVDVVVNYGTEDVSTENDGVSVEFENGMETYKHAIENNSGPWIRPNTR